MRETIEQKAIQYLNENKQKFLKEYSDGIIPLDEKVIVLTAGMSGIDKLLKRD
ncbi:hypothetical protein MLC52_04895 [Sulfurimonas sp. NW15]|uniref:hypothetical protein n=1 Tax=Sulfurimonas sp. NW15 TaxID=2922729 RepID=UPI003DA91230